jgi:cytochrome P450
MTAGPAVRSRTPALPPGPTAPALVQTLRYVLSPLRFAEACSRRYGDCFTVRLLGQPPTVVLSDLDAVRAIFTSDGAVMRAGDVNADVLRPILGRHSLMVLDDDRHLRHRRLMLPPFHGERLHAYGRILRDITDRVVDGWPVGRAFPIHPEMQAITLEGIGRAVLGIDPEPRHAELRALLRRIVALPSGATAPLLAIPALRLRLGALTRWGRFLRDRARLRERLLAEIARRRCEGGAGRDDVLSLLIEARDERGCALSDDELFDEVFTLLMAGQETTASALTWVLHQLLRHPEVLARLEAEIGAVIARRPLEAASLAEIEYLEAVIKETARLTPILTNVVRRLARPTRIGSRHLPAGINVSCSIHLTHRRPDLWPEPERFDPERFMRVRPGPYAFFPFGGGDRRCLGAAFATYEMKIVLARVISRVRLRIAPGYRMRPVMRMTTMTPSGGLPIVVEAREPASGSAGVREAPGRPRSA